MPRRTHLQDNQQERTVKSLWLIAAVGAFFLVLIVRIFFVQVLQAQTHIRLSKENRMQMRIIKAARGQIIDRNGEVIARNRPSYSICVLPYKLKKPARTIQALCSIRDINGNQVFDSTMLYGQFRTARQRRFDVTRLMEDVSLDLVSIIEEHSMEIPGIVVETESRREYPLGPGAFHVLGYMSEIPETQFDSLKNQGYHYGDLIGKAGLEKQYETIFRGKNGREYVEVNAYGKRMGRIPNMPVLNPVDGHDIHVSLDARLQRIADEAFPDTLRGAVVAIDPRNGDVLCVYSSPSVDPNIFSGSSAIRSRNWAAIATDPALPLNNRVIAGTYAPGSTFKLVSATAGLALGKVHAASRMSRPCTGAFRIGNRVARCWNPGGHGYFDLLSAVRQSCNVYFYQLGLMIGDKPIVSYAMKLGMGYVSGIDLPGEKAGYLSGEKAHNIRFSRRIAEREGWSWTQSLVCDMAIGQQQVFTPLQLARMVGALGNGRVLYRPFILKEIRTSDGAVINQVAPVVDNLLDLEPSVIAAMREAMEQVLGPGGTAGRARVPGVRVGGKTGSAENPHGDLTHSLFVACAPVDAPHIALAVVAENAGHGGSVAAPIAGTILRYYFTNIETPEQSASTAVIENRP